MTIPDFPSRASRIRQLGSASFLSFAPIVTKQERSKWVEYSNQMKPIVYQEGLDFEDADIPNITNAFDLIEYSYPDIFELEEDTIPWKHRPAAGDGPYLTYWQSVPLTPWYFVFTNYDIASSETQRNAVAASNTTRLPTIEYIVYQNPFNPEHTIVENQIFQPIFDRVYDGPDSKHEFSQNNPNPPKVVGFLWMVLDSNTYLKNILPETGADGIYVVLHSKCAAGGGFTFTYEINGMDAINVGIGDLHDPAYDHLEISSDFVSFGDANADKEGGNGDDGVCIPHLTVSLYPSKKLEDTFHTRDRYLYTAGAVAIFAFTTLIFCMYDMSVKRRQNIVMARLIQEDKLLSNMFPEAIRERLYANNNGGRHQDDSNRGSGHGHGGDPFDLDNDDNMEGAPLADLVSFVRCVVANGWEMRKIYPYLIFVAFLANEQFPAVTVVFIGTFEIFPQYLGGTSTMMMTPLINFNRLLSAQCGQALVMPRPMTHNGLRVMELPTDLVLK